MEPESPFHCAARHATLQHHLKAGNIQAVQSEHINKICVHFLILKNFDGYIRKIVRY